MKRVGQIFSAICIVTIFSFHAIRAFQLFGGQSHPEPTAAELSQWLDHADIPMFGIETPEFDCRQMAEEILAEARAEQAANDATMMEAIADMTSESATEDTTVEN